MIDVQVSIPDSVYRQFDSRRWAEALRRGMELSTNRYIEHASDYRRVAPPAVPTYARGYGPTRADGTVRALTSEKFNAQWTKTIRILQDDVHGRIGNRASYGIYVMGNERQAAFHRQRGWKTDQQVLNEEMPQIEQLFKREIVNVVRGR